MANPTFAGQYKSYYKIEIESFVPLLKELNKDISNLSCSNLSPI